MDYDFMRTRAPSNCTISKQMTSNSWPMRSIRAEWIGNAYISGSSCFVHRKSVSIRAMTSDMRTYRIRRQYGACFKEKECEHTAKKKNTTDSAMKRNGSCNHPRPRITARKTISTGRVTKSSVIVTSFVLGAGMFLPRANRAEVGVMESAAA
jgi:hypothetical protein